MIDTAVSRPSASYVVVVTRVVPSVGRPRAATSLPACCVGRPPEPGIGGTGTVDYLLAYA